MSTSRFAVCLLALLVATSASGQTVRLVDADGQASASSCADPVPATTTIGAAISAAVAGDTVLVCPGTYVENINFRGKAITVQSVAGPAVTVIDGNLAAPVVTFATGETASSVLQGFTIRNGLASLDGGGVRISGASPVIRGNVITGNRACEAMGISVSTGSPLIEDNTIANNIQYSCTGATFGGGILIAGPSSAVVRHNRISNNLGVMTGGGIALNAADSPTIELNLISGNRAEQGGGIGVINWSNPTIAGNVIVGNQADQGGGIYWVVSFGNRGPVVVNNTIAANNSATGSGIFADGFDGGTPVSNNVIVASASQTAIYCGNFNDVNPPLLQDNDVFSAAGLDYGGICGNVTGISGNISADPLFVDAATGDYRLQAGSAAIDAGSNGASGLPSYDFDGHARVIDGNADGLAIVDMGALETPGAGGAPGAFAKLAPANAATGQALVLSLAWQPSAGATAYEYCYDTIDNGSCDGTWIPAWNATSITVPSLSGGATYYWQVRARNDGGVTYADGSSTTFSAFTTAVPLLRRSIGLTGNLAFGGLMTGLSATRTLTITNSGNAVLTVSGIIGPPGFTATYPAPIPPGGSQAVTVTFSPAAVTGYSGTLLVVADQTDGTATAAVSGTGLTPAPVVMSSLLVNPSSPVNSGNLITLTATAFGGNGNLQYAFWRYKVSTAEWTKVRDYGGNTYAWYATDADADTYYFQVWVRSSGSAASYEGWLGAGPFEVRVPPPTVTSLTCSPAASVDVGTPMYCYAGATGGTAIDYRFWHYSGATGTWSLLQDYSASYAVAWTASTAGTDSVQVWVRSHASTAAYQDWRGTTVQVLSRPLSLSQLTANVSLPVPAGIYVKWSVTATGGVAPAQFEWWLYNATAGTWTLLSPYSTENSYTWRPLVPGDYNIEVWVRSAGSTATYEAWADTGRFTVTPNVVTMTSLTPNTAVFVTGTPMSWLALASGGVGPVQYQFWLYDATTGWSLLRDYSYASSVTWTPPHPGTFEVQVWVRDFGSTALYDAWLGYPTFTVK